MVNIVDTERLLKTIIAQFCDQNFKFTLNLKILGSIHVVVDNTEVLTCLLDEKYFKQANGSIVSRTSKPDANQLNLAVTTLNQLGSGSQAPTSSLSSKSTSSSSSTCSSSSYSSSESSTSSGKHNKRKRFVPRGLLSTATGVTGTNGIGVISGDEDEDDEDEKGENGEMMNNGGSSSGSGTNVQSSDGTPVKRGKTMADVESDEQAAATTLSLISASKMLMAPQLLGAAAAAAYHHNTYMQQQQANVPVNYTGQIGGGQQVMNASGGVMQPANVGQVQQPIMKPKSKYIR